MVDEYLAEQRRLTALALDVLARDQFALAGSGAIREHGLIDRPTRDVDLFTVAAVQGRFEPAIDRLVGHLAAHGYEVDSGRRQPGFAQLVVTSSAGVESSIDLGIDWRAEPAVMLDIGPVLSRDDAVGNKVAALFSRGETRDFLDVDAIRRSGQYSDDDLYTLAKRSDNGFTLSMLGQQLDRLGRFTPASVEFYGVTAEQLDGVKARLSSWRQDIGSRDRRGRDAAESKVTDTELDQLRSLSQAAFPEQPGRTTGRPVGADADHGRVGGHDPYRSRNRPHRPGAEGPER